MQGRVTYELEGALNSVGYCNASEKGGTKLQIQGPNHVYNDKSI
jgi:hypothetical protein